MDTAGRVLSLVNVSTTLTIVRFLTMNLDDWVSPLDTCLYSLLVIMCSELWGPKYEILRLSKRIGLLVLVERIRPFATMWQGIDVFLQVQSVVVNVLVLVLVSLVPMTEEGSTIVTSVVYMYSSMFDFLAAQSPMAVLPICAVVIYWSSDQKHCSRLVGLMVEILGASAASLVIAILALPRHTCHDMRFLFIALVTTMAYGASRVLSVSRSTQDFLVYLIASEASSTLVGWTWAGFMALAVAILRVWPGPKFWVTDCALVMLVNIIVREALRYIQFLAINDTFITLKTSALVIQFLIHELTLNLQET